MSDKTSSNKKKQLIIAGFVVLGLITLFLLYRTTQAELPEELQGDAPAAVPIDESDRMARAWLESAKEEVQEQQYAEGEVEPAMKGVELVPQTMGQGTREEAEKPEVLPEPLAAVLAAVNAPFRRTFDAFQSFRVNFSFVLTTAEPKLGSARTVGQVKFTKDALGNWEADYNVDTDSQTSSFNKPLYKSHFWLVGNSPYVRRLGEAPEMITEQAPVEDQELLNDITSGNMELLSHELLRRWVTEARLGVGYEEAGTDRWENRPVVVYKTALPHYGENEAFQVRTREGYIWIDREYNLPLKAHLSYTAQLNIPQGPMRYYDSTNRIDFEMVNIGTAPTVAIPDVKSK